VLPINCGYTEGYIIVLKVIYKVNVMCVRGVALKTTWRHVTTEWGCRWKKN